MDWMKEIALDLARQLSAEDLKMLKEYMAIMIVLDQTRDPELKRLKDEFWQRLDAGDLSKQEHREYLQRMRSRVDELESEGGR